MALERVLRNAQELVSPRRVRRARIEMALDRYANVDFGRHTTTRERRQRRRLCPRRLAVFACTKCAVAALLRFRSESADNRPWSKQLRLRPVDISTRVKNALGGWTPRCH